MELGRIRAWAYGASQTYNSLSLAEAGSMRVRPEELESSAEQRRPKMVYAWSGSGRIKPVPLGGRRGRV